jgi:hypothetical protein
MLIHIKEIGCEDVDGLIWFRMEGPVTGSCEHGTETSGRRNVRNVLDRQSSLSIAYLYNSLHIQ